jgi:hypothetical protein
MTQTTKNKWRENSGILLAVGRASSWKRGSSDVSATYNQRGAGEQQKSELSVPTTMAVKL